MISRAKTDLDARDVLCLFGVGWFLPYLFYTLWAHGFLPLESVHRHVVSGGSLDGLWRWVTKHSVWLILAVQLTAGCALVLSRRGLSWGTLGFRRTTGAWFLMALVALVASYVCSGMLQVIFQLPEAATGVPAANSQAQAAGYSYGYLLSMLLMAGPATAFVEEVAFRGALYGWLRTSIGPIAGIVVSSVIFGFFHLRFVNPSGMVGLVATLQIIMGGAMLAFLYEKSGSLWPAIYLHGINNLIGTLQIIAPR